MSYSLSKKAESDLESIWDFTIARWSEEQATEYLSQLFLTFQQLTEYPQSGKNIPHIEAGYRVMKSGSHWIFYRCADETHIWITRVLHQSMNIDDEIDFP